MSHDSQCACHVGGTCGEPEGRDAPPPELALLEEARQKYWDLPIGWPRSIVRRLSDALEKLLWRGSSQAGSAPAFADARGVIGALADVQHAGREISTPRVGAGSAGSPEGPTVAESWGPPTEEELGRLNNATNATLTHEAPYAFKDTPAAQQAKYLIKRWREIAQRFRGAASPSSGEPIESS